MTNNYGHTRIILAIIIIIIVYGSLYPFAFSVPDNGEGPLRTLIESWSVPPGRGDLIANILLYMPLGFFGVRAFRQTTRFWVRFSITIGGGALLSVAMELAQYFDPGRVTNASDVYSNAVGTALGSLGAAILPGNRRLVKSMKIVLDPVPIFLIATWVGYRTYPFVPTIDAHKYWSALKPLILDHPTVRAYDVYRYTAIWLTLFSLIERIVGRHRSRVLAPLFVGFILFARVLVVDTVLSVGEMAGGVVAVCAWPILLVANQPWRSIVPLLLLGCYVVAERLQPFDFLPISHNFGWIPFLSLMSGSIEIDVLAFLEKCFLYGSLIFLLREIGCPLSISAILVAAMLFTTSWIERYLPGRSAEITDSVMALLLAGGFRLVDRRQNYPGR